MTDKECQDCFFLVEQNNKYFCDELQKYCEDIERCPEVSEENYE